jgi:hypothetical protein
MAISKSENWIPQNHPERMKNYLSAGAETREGTTVTNANRQEIIEYILELIEGGATRQWALTSVQQVYGVKDSRAKRALWNAAISQIENAPLAEKAATTVIAKCERVYEEGINQKKLSDANKSLELIAKVSGLLKDTPMQNNIEIKY